MRSARATIATCALGAALCGALAPVAGAGTPVSGAPSATGHGAGQRTQVAPPPQRSLPSPSKKTGTYMARILVGTVVRRRPGGDGRYWYARTRTKWSGSAQRLMVLRSTFIDGRLWLKVRLPTRPNGAAGWIPRDRVRLSHTSRYIVVDTSSRTLRVYKKGRVISRFRVVVGAPSTPTPHGLFAIYDRVKQADPHGFEGTWILPLTAHSDKLRRFEGGPGLVALHGRAGASFLDPLGSARSHGCIRMNNSRINHLSGYPPGTAVRVRR